MGRLLAFLVLVCGPVASGVGADRAFPYKAQVVTDGAPLRSGPGEQYYATEELRLGTEVEVYRHGPKGW